MTDIAHQLLQDKRDKLEFNEIWNGICKELQLNEEQSNQKIAVFYTQLIIDGRFVTLGENVWDLRERCTFDKVHIDMNDVYVDEEEDIDLYDEEDMEAEEEGLDDEDEEEKEKEDY
jgi:DNA-directed RNA polymerase subunit delta